MGKRISLSRKHALGVEGATQKLSDLTSQFAAKYGLSVSLKGQTASVSGRGVDGTVKVTGEAIAVDLELGFLLGPLAGKIEEGIKRQLETHFA